MNPQPEQITQRQALERRLPRLLRAANRTTSSAMHKITWTGKLARWNNFGEDVRAKVREPWSPTVIDLALESHDLKQEQILVADELGVRGRFQQAVGQVLGTVFQAELVHIRFADFKAAGVSYPKTPDVAMVPREGSAVLKALGEIKVPWIDDHKLAKRTSCEALVRSTIGQIAEYMIDNRVPYGFHSTYNEVIFLRYVQKDGEWRMEVSPVVSNKWSEVSVNECFWYFSSLAVDGQPIEDNTDKDDLLHNY